MTGNVITATPAAGYYVESCTVTAGTATYTINGNTITVNASSDCTIRVNFAPKPQYTVNFIASGVSQGSETAYVQDAITLPNSVSIDPDGWTFIGWAEAQIDETEVEPTYYAPGASYTVNGNATLYALYNRVEGGTGNETVYELVTAAPSDWAGNYVITNNTTNISSAYVLKGVTGSSNGTNAETASNCTAFANTGITYEDGVLRNVPSDYVMTVAANGSYYTIKAPNNTYYGMNSSSYLYSYSTLNSTYCLWTPGINSNGVAQFKNKANGSYPYFSWSTSNNYFWSGSSNNANVLRLYKEHVINTDTTYYATDPVVAQPTYYTVTFKDWDGTTLKTEEVLEGAAATAPTDPTRDGYTFTGWDVDFSNVTADLVVTAQYQINTYTVIFKDWDGTTLKTETVNYGGAATAPADPTRDGWTFTGWDVDFSNVTSDLVVTAQYTENGLVVTLLGDVDLDGEVTATDALLAMRHAMSITVISGQGFVNGDMDGDGQLTSSDAILIMRAVMGL